MRACVGDGGPFRTPARATKLGICAAVGRKRAVDGSRGDAERSRGHHGQQSRGALDLLPSALRRNQKGAARGKTGGSQ